MLESVLTETVNTGITMGQFLLCTITSVMLGVVLAAVHTYRNQYSRSFILTLVLLPVMVQTVIMLVNGNLGTGVAVMGAFSLCGSGPCPAMQERLEVYSWPWLWVWPLEWGIWEPLCF